MINIQKRTAISRENKHTKKEYLATVYNMLKTINGLQQENISTWKKITLVQFMISVQRRMAAVHD